MVYGDETGFCYPSTLNASRAGIGWCVVKVTSPVNTEPFGMQAALWEHLRVLSITSLHSNYIFIGYMRDDR